MPDPRGAGLHLGFQFLYVQSDVHSFVHPYVCLLRSKRVPTHSLRDKAKKGQRDKGANGQRDKGTKGQRDKGTKGQRDKGTMGQKDKGKWALSYMCDSGVPILYNESQSIPWVLSIP